MSLLTLTIARHEILTPPPFGDRLHRNDNSSLCDITVRRYKRLWLVAVRSVVCIRVSLILEERVARLLSSSD